MNTTAKSIIILAASLTLCGCPNITGEHKREAETQARLWAQELGLDVKTVACVRQDTDGDGYVSCTFKLGDGGVRTYECAGAWNLNTGCREQKINLRSGGY